MRTLISGARILTPDEMLPDHTLVIQDGKIHSIQAGRVAAGENDRLIDARGMWAIPGLIDIHVHGAVGHDTMDATPEALHAMARFFAEHGVTAYLPTTLAASAEATQAAIDNVMSYPQLADGARHLGVHLEGPYLSPEFRGAQPPAHLRKPARSEYETWLASDVVRLFTLAPELEGALALMDEGGARGVEFAVGHSGASYEQMLEAADHGLRQATHTFNGMAGLHHRAPGTLGAVLVDDRIYAQVIADGVHVHPGALRLLLRAKGIQRIILITDAMCAAGLGDGDYDLGGQPIAVRDGVARTLEGGLAGSTLTLDQALRNMMRFTGLSLSQALPMATSVPAEAMGWLGRRGVLQPGADADVVLLDADLRVRQTFIAGETVWRSEDGQT